MRSGSKGVRRAAPRGRSGMSQSAIWRFAFGCYAAQLCGCTSYGPTSITVDRLRYSEAVSASWKEQMLLNLVKLRYLDVPLFLDVGQIVSGYTLESRVSADGRVVWPSAPDSVGLGGSYAFTDRPTITYTPMVGDRFLRSVITPILPKAVFFLLQSGYPADFVLGLTLSAINGMRNPMATSPSSIEPDLRFGRILEIFRDLQLLGAFGVRGDAHTASQEAPVIFFRSEGLPPKVVAEIAELKGLLGLAPESASYRLVYSPARGEPDSFSVQSRSVLQVLLALSASVETPDRDEEEGRAVPAMKAVEGSAAFPFKIHHGEERPKDAFVAVPYRGGWFWIDDRDWRTKRIFAFLLFIFTLSEGGNSEQLPVLTIPTG